jgi:hypothetical protein
VGSPKSHPPDRFSKLAVGATFLLQGNLSTGPFVDASSAWGTENEATASQLFVSKDGHFQPNSIESALTECKIPGPLAIRREFGCCLVADLKFAGELLF